MYTVYCMTFCCTRFTISLVCTSANMGVSPLAFYWTIMQYKTYFFIKLNNQQHPTSLHNMYSYLKNK